MSFRIQLSLVSLCLCSILFYAVLPLSAQETKKSNTVEVIGKSTESGLGSYSTLSIRGSNANQVRIYVDGVPLNNAQGGEVNLSDLSFDNLEKIEIYKSGSSPGFSGSAIGGTVNLVTSKSFRW